MNFFTRPFGALALSLILCAVALSCTNGLAGETGRAPGVLMAKLTADTPPDAVDLSPLDARNPKVRAAMDVQNRHHRELMAIPDVIGTGTGVDDAGAPSVVVFARRELPAGALPKRLDGVSVKEVTSGEVYALKRTGGVNNLSVFTPPSPIGVSTGNIGECSAGTIGCRLKDSSGNLYALSNNHVYARENKASIGSACIQPGKYDTVLCWPYGKTATYNVIGALTSYVPIDFSGGTNYVDCAVATVITTSAGAASLGTSTPSTGYGTPNSKTWSGAHNGDAPPIGLAVQKYGRTTSLTKGQVYAINVTLKVDYGTSGVAVFADQIAVYSPKAFIKAGDSGSLLVTNDSNDYPVGLLYAGNSAGTFAYANPIEAVLGSLGAGTPGSPTPAAIPGLGIDGK